MTVGNIHPEGGILDAVLAMPVTRLAVIARLVVVGTACFGLDAQIHTARQDKAENRSVSASAAKRQLTEIF